MARDIKRGRKAMDLLSVVNLGGTAGGTISTLTLFMLNVS